MINDKPMNTSPEPLIEKLTNINIYEVNKSIIKDFNKIIAKAYNKREKNNKNK